MLYILRCTHSINICVNLSSFFIVCSGVRTIQTGKVICCCGVVAMPHAQRLSFLIVKGHNKLSKSNWNFSSVETKFLGVSPCKYKKSYLRL